jgi:GxxExxY protein
VASSYPTKYFICEIREICLKQKNDNWCIKKAKMTDNELTYEIRGAIFDVYNELGPGLLESVYEEALAFELKERGLIVAKQVEVPVIYKGNELKTPLRLDLLVNDQVIVELKSVEEMKPVFAKQLLTYLKLMDKRVGLLVNFNTSNLRESIKRIVN